MISPGDGNPRQTSLAEYFPQHNRDLWERLERDRLAHRVFVSLLECTVFRAPICDDSIVYEVENPVFRNTKACIKVAFWPLIKSQRAIRHLNEQQHE